MILAAWIWTGLLALLAVHTAANAVLLRRPPAHLSGVDAPVAVLLPVRDEAHRVRPTVRSLLAQLGVPGLQLWVLDDGSTDGTADVIRAEAAGDPRLHLLAGSPLPPDWLGKPYACHQLATAVGSTVDRLVFVDADVVLAPDAVAAAVALLEEFDLVSAYPRILALSPGERLIQPLLAWSWLTFLPLRAMERSPRPALAAAGGQFLALRRDAYERAGGHRAVGADVLEDIALARAVKRSGGRITLAGFSRLASCRMYEGWSDLAEGYSKSLWAARVPVLALLLLYAVPGPAAVLAAALGAWPVAWPLLCGYVLGVLGRIIAAARTGSRLWPDPLAQPVSVALLGLLVLRSRRRHRHGLLRWKGRTVP